jgi:hypothetical protein
MLSYAHGSVLWIRCKTKSTRQVIGAFGIHTSFMRLLQMPPDTLHDGQAPEIISQVLSARLGPVVASRWQVTAAFAA